MNGKGDKRRPTDEVRFRANFDEIDWHKPVICPGCGWEIDPDCCHCGTKITKHTAYDGHSPTPQGCTCGYADAAARKNPDYTRPTALMCMDCNRTIDKCICYEISRQAILRR